MVIDDFDLMGVALAKFEADTPACVDGHGPLVFTIALELVQAHALKRTEVADHDVRIHFDALVRHDVFSM